MVHVSPSLATKKLDSGIDVPEPPEVDDQAGPAALLRMAGTNTLNRPSRLMYRNGFSRTRGGEAGMSVIGPVGNAAAIPVLLPVTPWITMFQTPASMFAAS